MKRLNMISEFLELEPESEWDLPLHWQSQLAERLAVFLDRHGVAGVSLRSVCEWWALMRCW